MPIVATIGTSQNLHGGLIPGGNSFGRMDPTYSFTGVSHAEKDGKVYLTATMLCDYHWGVRSLGNTDIATPTDPLITADNYEAIAADLTPDASNSAPYAKYWSKAATTAHELEHARDDWADWAAHTTGKNLAVSGFGKETVKSNAIDVGLTALQTAGGSGRHPGKIASQVITGSDIHYGASMAYMARPGEIKAHAVGATIERPLAAGIRAHGKQLVAAATAKKEAEAKAAAAAAAPPSRDEGAKSSASRGALSRALGGESADRTVSAIMSMFS